MSAQRMVAIVWIVLGVLGLAWGGFSYTRQTHQADVGSLHLSVDETEHVRVPVWVGLGALPVGFLLLGVGRKN